MVLQSEVLVIIMLFSFSADIKIEEECKKKKRTLFLISNILEKQSLL